MTLTRKLSISPEMFASLTWLGKSSIRWKPSCISCVCVVLNQMEDYGVYSCVCVVADLGLCLYLGLLGVCGGGGVVVVVVP